MLNGIKPLCLTLLLLLSACHSASVRPPPHDATASAPIDPTKSLFRWTNIRSLSISGCPGPQRQVAVLDDAAQQRHFSALKSHYFGMGPNEESPGIRITSLPS